MMETCRLHAQRLCRRRAVLRAALALAPWVVFPAGAQDQAGDPTSQPPQPGDRLIFLAGIKKGEPARSGDLELGGPPAQVYPADPKGNLRNGTRLNLVVLARVGSDGINEETRERSADGVVAYSGICTHQACPVNMWSKDRKLMVCSCHGSTYDPRNGAEVLSGPAPWRLAALPLKSENGLLTVAGGFTGRVGMHPN
jgi:rieske iron-sulfur protein